MKQPSLVILDRDGVINEDSVDYIKDADEWLPIPGSLEAIAKLTAKKVPVAIATNQAGIGRGLFDEYSLARIHARMIEAIEDAGGRIELIAFCPHHPDDACECRKPKPGLLFTISEELAISLEDAVIIGDSKKDIEAGRAAGTAAQYLVLTGKGADEREKFSSDMPPVFADLAAAVDHLLDGPASE